MYEWVGSVTPGTGSGPCRQVIIGTTDYEFFGRSSAQEMASCRRRGHCHFFAMGDNLALRHVVDIFKQVAPSTL